VTASVLLVRLLPGLIGESRRVVHVVPLPAGSGVLEVPTAYCGEQIEAGTAEVLGEFGGMPCERCVFAAPLPQGDELRAGG
jgi:hypothetical protein